jgi:hypothetical protein
LTREKGQVRIELKGKSVRDVGGDPTNINAMLDIVSTFQKVSTKPDQAHLRQLELTILDDKGVLRDAHRSSRLHVLRGDPHLWRAHRTAGAAVREGSRPTSKRHPSRWVQRRTSPTSTWQWRTPSTTAGSQRGRVRHQMTRPPPHSKHSPKGSRARSHQRGEKPMLYINPVTHLHRRADQLCPASTAIRVTAANADVATKEMRRQ